VISNNLINKSIFLVEELSNELILEEKQNILRQYYDSLTARHPGIKKTLRKVLEHHSWPELKQFTNYVKGYENCCQGQNSRGRRYRVIDRSYTPERSNVLRQRGIILSNSIRKAPADRQGYRSGEQLIKRPWLQLMCCAPVSGCEVGCVFWSDGSRQDRGPKETIWRSQNGQDKIRTRWC